MFIVTPYSAVIFPLLSFTVFVATDKLETSILSANAVPLYTVVVYLFAVELKK